MGKGRGRGVRDGKEGRTRTDEEKEGGVDEGGGEKGTPEKGRKGDPMELSTDHHLSPHKNKHEEDESN